jgi:C-terminal peptidase prc
MRGLWVWWSPVAAVALLTFALVASTGPGPGPAGSQTAGEDTLRAEAVNYAHLILNYIAFIELQYIRPVASVDLAEAALAGLYEAARQPFPAALKADLQRLRDDSQRADSDLLSLLIRAREQLGQNEALRAHRDVLVSLQALPRVMDPHSGLTAPQDAGYLEKPEGVAATGLEFADVMVPVFTGFAPGGGLMRSDLMLTYRSAGTTGPARIRTVIPGSPAQRSGLRPGDLIVKLNGQPPEAPVFADLLRRLLPPQPGVPMDPPTGLRLTLLRPGRSEPLEVALTAAPFRSETVFGARRNADGSWEFSLSPTDRIGYVRLGSITENGSDSEFSEALRSLRRQAVRGLVFDLRWCPGGSLRAAANITHLLLPEGAPIASQRNRHGQIDPVVPTLRAAPYLEFPIVVLIGSETTGGGELIAAALQDNGRAVIAGQRTAGKGSVQSLEMKQHYGIPFKITSWTFTRPSGKNLQRFPDSKPTDDWGVRPDAGRELPLTAESGRKLKEQWIMFQLRPGNSTEALPLDDPENDPQRHTAVQILRELMKKR